jgi:hypothetical protein
MSELAAGEREEGRHDSIGQTHIRHLQAEEGAILLAKGPFLLPPGQVKAPRGGRGDA